MTLKEKREIYKIALNISAIHDQLLDLQDRLERLVRNLPDKEIVKIIAEVENE